MKICGSSLHTMKCVSMCDGAIHLKFGWWTWSILPYSPSFYFWLNAYSCAYSNNRSIRPGVSGKLIKRTWEREIRKMHRMIQTLLSTNSKPKANEDCMKSRRLETMQHYQNSIHCFPILKAIVPLFFLCLSVCMWFFVYYFRPL